MWLLLELALEFALPIMFIFIASLETLRGKPGGPIMPDPSGKPPPVPGIFPGPLKPNPPPILGLAGPPIPILTGIFMGPGPRGDSISGPSFLVEPR